MLVFPTGVGLRHPEKHCTIPFERERAWYFFAMAYRERTEIVESSRGLYARPV